MSAVFNHSNLNASLKNLTLDSGAPPGETAPPSFTTRAADACADTASSRRLNLCNQLFELCQAHTAAPPRAKPTYAMPTYQAMPAGYGQELQVLWFFKSGDGVVMQTAAHCKAEIKNKGIVFRKDAASGSYQVIRDGKPLSGPDQEEALDMLVEAIGKDRFKEIGESAASAASRTAGTAPPVTLAMRRSDLCERLLGLVDAHHAAPESAKPSYMYDTFDPRRHTAEKQALVLRFFDRRQGVVLQRAADCIAGRDDRGISLRRQPHAGRFQVIQDGQCRYGPDKDAPLDQLAFAFAGHSFGEPLSSQHFNG